MRWLVFVLLVLGALFSVSAFAPTAVCKAEFFWPFSANSRSIVSFVGLPGERGGVATTMLAGGAGLSFVAAIVGLFWQVVSTRWWSVFVTVAAVMSLALHVVFFGELMIAPLVVDAVLLWGVVTRHWTADVRRMRTLHSGAARIHPLMHVPVPWVYVLTFLAGMGLQYLAPLTIQSAGALRIGFIAGILLTVAGVLLAFSSLGIFRAVGTTTVPFERASKLVTWGPYRLTRNPMYLGLLLTYVGVAGMQAQIWPVLLLPLLIIYLRRVVIPVEEARLRDAFGDTYKLYCARVRRWM